MFPICASIRSSEVTSSKWKLFGQSLLERNIRLLMQGGAKKIYLDLNSDDLNYYESKIKKHVAGLPGIEIIQGICKSEEYILVSANHFILFSAITNFKENFTKDKGISQPLIKDNQYIIVNDDEFDKARKIAIEGIRTGSGGKLAQNINKRISIPISLVLSRLRVSPNLITVINFFLGVLSIVLLFSSRLFDQAAGGILVQACSIIDGCDGEVARMTTRFSKLGGLLDTMSDQLLAAALIVVALQKVYVNFSPDVFIITMLAVISGVTLMVSIIIFFMRRYTESMSFASYTREFLEILPESDYTAKAMRYLQYLARKELYSMMVCLFCLFGALQYYMIFFSLVAVAGSLLMLFLSFRYFPKLKRIKH